jgi:lipopolysaccharide assembly outer membrane protein LptD (OstA)
VRAPLASAVLALLLAFAASAQEQVGPPAQPPPPAQAGASAEQAGAAEAPAENIEPADALVQATLGEDIATAGYYELLDWCRELDLNDAGSSQDLRGRLYAYYQLKPPPAPEKPKRVLQILSARSSEYFTIEPIDEDTVLLQGDVLVELQEENSTHRIRAQRVLLNQTANLLTAEGNLEYTFKSGEREDVFHGERLTFDVESWEGVFFSGGMEGDRQVAGKNVRFRFQADSISKLQRDVVVMERGTITSCDLPDPHYHIKARKIWVLAPGEWAIANAVLYIGRLPVMYLPFFFRPGDQFFFHPAIGTRDREGNFLQTTTYLIGQKPRTPSAISVLAATEEQGQQYRRVIKGLFLRQPEGEKVPVTDNRFLKIFLDFYSRLGAFTGISGDFSPKGSFRAGIGLSRNIYYDNGYYTPWVEEDGTYRSLWNKAWLFGMQLPFRYGLDGKWSLSKGTTQVSGKFEYYSDPFFARDFYNRSEETSIARLLGMQTTDVTQTAEGEKRGLTSQMSLPTLGAGMRQAKISVPYLNANLYWQSKLPDYYALLTDLERYKLAPDPTVYFYYPVSLKLPSAALQVSGVLLSLPSGATAPPSQPASAPAAPAGAEGLRRPAPESIPPASTPAGATPASLPASTPSPEVVPASKGQPAEESSARLLLSGEAPVRPPLPRQKLPEMTPTAPVAFTLSYQARPTVAVEQSFNSAAWTEPSQVTYDLNYTNLETSTTSSLDWALKIYESLFTLNGSLGLNGSYRTKFRQSYPEDTSWQSLVLGDYRYSQMQVKNVLSASFSPFYADPRFRSTHLSYAVNWLPFRYALDDAASTYGVPVYIGLPPGWNVQTFTQHQAEAAVGMQAGEHLQSLSVSAQLPPLDPTITSRMDAYLWRLRSNVVSVYREQENLWSLVAQESLELTPKLRLNEELQMDLMAGAFLRSVSSIAWGGFTAAFTAQQLSTEALEAGSVSAAYRLAQSSLYFWKNRSRVEASLNTSWSMNLYENSYGSYDNSLTFSFTLKYYLYKFLEISFTSTSYNNRTYRYFPGLAARVGDQWVNPLTDLLKSFNFFNVEDRYNSAFKLKGIAVDMVHHLHDWDLTLHYEGKPLLQSLGGKPTYTWGNTFSILLQWIPIPEMRTNMTYDSSQEEGFQLRD